MADFLTPSTQCPVCNSPQISKSFKTYYWKEYEFQFFDCAKCDASFANPMPSDELISRGNSALVHQSKINRSSESEFREARQAYLRGKLFARQLMKWKKRGKLLELGCFNGFFALGVQDHSDWNVEGLEISSELQAFVQNDLKIKCHLGTLEEARLPKNSYDFIVCHDLIEHINRPQLFLEQISSILAPGGRIQIITPNGIQDLAFFRRAHRQGITLNMQLNHILYFSPKTLKKALNRAGISTKKLYCYDLRYVLKDFGILGLGKPTSTPPLPSLTEALSRQFDPKNDQKIDRSNETVLPFWTPEKLNELRSHTKTSFAYGFFKETLPRAFRLKVPYPLPLGHEIFALGEKQY